MCVKGGLYVSILCVLYLPCCHLPRYEVYYTVHKWFNIFRHINLKYKQNPLSDFTQADPAAKAIYKPAVWFYVCTSVSTLPFTYADDIHEAIHAVADLEEQVLTLPLGRGAEGGPDEPGDAGDEKKGTQNNGSYLHLLYHRQRDGLPLGEETNVQN